MVLVALAASLGVLLPAAWALAWDPPWDQQDWPKQLFDHRCADVALGPDSSVRVHCAADGSVAALEAPVDFQIAHRLTARTWVRRTSPRWRRPGLAISAADTIVVVEQTTCGMCRRVMGHTWALRPPLAPAAVLRAAQEAAELSPSPLLRTVAAWRAAIGP